LGPRKRFDANPVFLNGQLNAKLRNMPAALDEVERQGIETAAFMAYVMHKENCSQLEALTIMGKYCATIQISLGLEKKQVRNACR
jgi:hypothetical protein